jgi:hypothetical protein
MLDLSAARLAGAATQPGLVENPELVFTKWRCHEILPVDPDPLDGFDLAHRLPQGVQAQDGQVLGRLHPAVPTGW